MSIMDAFVLGYFIVCVLLLSWRQSQLSRPHETTWRPLPGSRDARNDPNWWRAVT